MDMKFIIYMQIFYSPDGQGFICYSNKVPDVLRKFQSA